MAAVFFGKIIRVTMTNNLDLGHNVSLNGLFGIITRKRQFMQNVVKIK